MPFFSTNSITQSQKSNDKIVPLHFFDDGPLWRAFVLYSMFVFDCPLDVEKLRISLEGLVHKEGWWKLGARLGRDKDGNLEYHIPDEYTIERPAIAYSHLDYQSEASAHPIASRIPKASNRPSVVGYPDEYLDLMRPIGAPSKLDDYITSDRPQMGLHIVTFRDMTLVTLYWPHTLMDAMGKAALVEAWCLMLDGKGSEVKTPHGADADPFTTLGTMPKEPHKLERKQMGLFGLAGYGLGQAMNFIRKQESRMVCVPLTFVEKLREHAIADLMSAEPMTASKPFLSEGDVLCAWWTRLAVAHLPPTSAQTVVLNMAYDIRKPLRQDLLPENAPYVSNAVSFVHAILSVRDIMEKPLSHVAAAIRRAIAELGTREQVEAFFSLLRNNSAKLPPFFGDRNMHMITYSNWTKTNFFQVDFSSAVTDGSGSIEAKPRYVQNNQFGLTLPNGYPIMGKDNQGNYWLSGYMSPSHWDNIESILAQETWV